MTSTSAGAGAIPEGRKELIGFTDGARESAQDWRQLLLDLKRRGLPVPPELAVADGAFGFWTAVGELWPQPRCVLICTEEGAQRGSTAQRVFSTRIPHASGDRTFQPPATSPGPSDPCLLLRVTPLTWQCAWGEITPPLMTSAS